MRRTIVVLAGVLMVSGCTGGPQRLDGEAAPAGAVPPTPQAASASSAAPRPVPSSKSPSPPAPKRSRTTTADAAPTRFSRDGLGKLKLGMTEKQALATGLVANRSGDDRCSTFELVPANWDGVAVVYSEVHGVVAIPGYGSISTPEGIRIGSTLAEVRAAYPDLDERLLDVNGKVFAKRTDGDGSHYEFVFDDSRRKTVDFLSVGVDEPDC
ncbi:hypothetical protein AB0G04_13565 [Actinoplanes sp. NPDC023801]|uniref:hypothetical protein n=1 Tax=Actinoplanes sp. NPDC023801 TaxID=3154595 RepID=UPI0033C0A7E8